MLKVVKAVSTDCSLLCTLAEKTFRQSHGHSASAADINAYVSEKYAEDVFRSELSNGNNHYHFIYDDEVPARFSNIILNASCPGYDDDAIAKLDRIYILEQFLGTGLGTQLFNFNIDLAKQNRQKGLWLYVWKENKRAVDFYLQKGFIIIGSYDFKISATHSNPNHRMLLLF